MSQSRRSSLAESVTNIAVGYAVNFIANLLVLPLFGFDVTVTQNLGLGAIYTVVSLVRSYGLRRWFNRRVAT